MIRPVAKDRSVTRQENSITAATYSHIDPGVPVIKDLGGGTVTHYVFDLSGTLIAEADATGATQREYINVDGLPVGFIEGTTLYFVHPDHSGAPQKITDAAKAVVWHGQFTPFGEELSIAGALTANWRFPGQYHDAEAALSYNYFRTYDPTLGRYLQSDPIGLDGGFNTYSYALSNPVRIIDPRGLKVKFAPGSSDTFKKQFKEAIGHLNKHGASKVIADLEKLDETVYVRESHHPLKRDSYDIRSRTILWDSTVGLCHERGTMSPALILVHEADHALGFLTGTAASLAPDGSPYDNAEEKRVITGAEADAAKKLNEPTRRHHRGDLVPVQCPSCTK